MEHLESEPQREPLRFDIDTSGMSEEMQLTMQQIKKLAESMLYHWRRFPMILPPSITDAVADSGDSAEPLITFRDLFVAPTFDELDEVALDKNGCPRKLTNKQLQQVREHGEFEVDSIHFPSQTHKWRLTQLLQKGTITSQNSLLNDMALALRLVIITARNRFYSHFFSVSHAFKSILRAGWQLLDILVGMPWNTPGKIDEKLRQEHMRYLVAELEIRPICRSEWLQFCDFIIEKEQVPYLKQKTADIRPPPVPYRFQTPKGQEIDLRLFSKDLMDKCSVILKDILEREAKTWYIKFKDKILTEVKDENLSHQEIVELVITRIFDEYIRRVFIAIESSEDLENLQPHIGHLLVQQAKASLAASKAAENLRQMMSSHKKDLEDHLVKAYPVRSRIRAWKNEKLQAFQTEFIAQNQWAAHEEAIEICRQQSLDQAVYFLQRDLIFMRDRDPVLQKELGKVKIPKRRYSFRKRIWFPHKWIIKRHYAGETEIIPTVIVDTPNTAIVRHQEASDTYFSVEKYTVRETSTRYFFWRWNNYLQRTLAYMLNTMFVLGVVIPWCSPVSLRALFFPKPFLPDLQLSQVNLRNPEEPSGFTTYGTLCPKQSSLTHTLASRLRALWRHVRESRAQFESAPDTGFLGKALTRAINQIWNYGLKGACGSFLLVTIFPPICLITSLLSLLAAITTVIWMPCITLLLHVLMILFYDWDHPDSSSNAVMYLFEAIIWRFLILGLLQPLGALIAGVICCPLAAAVVTIAGVVRRGLRAVWDLFMFHAIIKKRARVPASDSFIVRRVAGPGLAANYFFQIKPEQVLAAVEAQMEIHELKAWQNNVIKVIDEPKKHYADFVAQVFKPFSAGLIDQGVYKSLDKETQHLHQVLKREIEQRKQRLRTGVNADLQARIKLTSRELKVTVTQTAKMLESFYPDHVIKRLNVTDEEFWESRNLEAGDWQGLSTQLLCETFSSSFLTPLEEVDTCFKLEVTHLNLLRYSEMLKSAEFRDDLDVVSAVHTPKGDIDVDPPTLDPSVFIPTRHNVPYADFYKPRHPGRRRPWKKALIRLQELEKLEVPLPISHPAVIAVMVHNRENDQSQIALDSDLVQHILRVSIGLPYLDLRDPTMVDFYDLDPEVSTPDHTTNSDGEIPTSSHLAEQEGAFSEDNFTIATPDSMPSSPQNAPELTSTPDLPQVTIELQSSPFRQPSEVNVEADEEAGAVVYSESEADNSCVLDINDTKHGPLLRLRETNPSPASPN